MAIDPHYIPAFSIEDVLLDKDTGAPLSGGKVYFEQDNQRGVLKPVYQITGTSPNYTYTQLPNPMTLSAIGTFEDALSNPVIPYFYPYDSELEPEYYYVRVTSEGDVEQFAREAVPYIPDTGEVSLASAFVNELSNPQFANAFFQSPTVYSFNAASNEVVSIAPGWDIVVSSSGIATVTLSIITPTGSLNRPTNPGTILNLHSAGLTSFVLRQRIYGSPNLWGTGYLSGTFIAKTYAGAPSTLNMLYSQSNGVVVDQIISSALLTADGLYDEYPGSVLIPVSTSTNFYPSAYIDIKFNIPLSTQIDISSVMVAFTGDVNVDNIDYDQTTLDRQIDQLFHYYKPQLDFKPIPSYLVGWDFPLNPALANGSTVAASASANSYTWDQTILYQSTVSKIDTSRAANGSMVLTSTDVANATKAALIQYLPQTTTRSMLLNHLSSNVKASTTHVGGLACTVSLWFTTNGSVPILPSGMVTTLDANGHPSAVAAGWIEVPRSTGLGNAKMTLGPTLINHGFNGWDLSNTSIPSTATFFAIVVGTGAINNGATVTFDSISVVPGDIPTIPAPQTLDEVLRECQYYYEKSYPVSVLPGAISSDGVSSAEMLSSRAGGINDIIISRQFGIRFNTQKRSSNTLVALYANTGEADSVSGYLYSSGAQIGTGPITVTGNWAATIGRTGAVYLPTNVNTLLAATVILTTTSESFIEYQYTADSRLGVVL